MKTNGIISKFDEWCEKAPDLKAIVSEGICISYKELGKRTQEIEIALTSLGINTGDIVCILAHRSVFAIEVVFGLLRIGAIYMPIDISFPSERINYILDDSKCQFLITDEKSPSVFQNRNDLKIISIDDIGTKCEQYVNAFCKKASICNDVSKGNGAYVLYTSGSTGFPKGVLVRIDSLVNFFNGISERIDFNPGERVLALTTFSFDISILEIVFPLTRGMTIVFATDDVVKNVRKLANFIYENQIDVLQMTPTRIRLLLLGNRSKKWLTNVSKLLIGGEVFPFDLLDVFRNYTKLRIFNLYGPTETTIWASVAELTNRKCVSIGRPLKGTVFCIMDEAGIEVKRGCSGEIYIGGKQLAEGYVNNEDLTNEKFIYHNNTRYYRTGDFGKKTDNGEYEFVGRSDDIVKIRGYLVSTNEIERVMMNYPKIERAIVFARKDIFSSFLCAVYKEKENICISDLQEYMELKLPGYMIPREYYKVGKFPETLNNKIDKKALINTFENN